LIRENGIAAKTKRKYKATTTSKHSFSVAGNLLKQNFTTDRPNHIWVADITSIPTDEGWLNLAAILDLFSERLWAGPWTAP
jgi:putative transposase